MELRRFGATDLRPSSIGLGCARIGGVFQQDPGGFLDLLSAALDGGINFFDTADMYSQGESESLLGRAFQGRRERVILASKAGYRLPAQRRLAARLKPLLRPVIRALGLRRESLPAAVRGEPTQDFSPAYLAAAVEGSLRRLRTDRLDLFQLHSPPAAVVERGEWVQALEALRQQGKIRYWGVSCDTPEAARAALRIPGLSSLQLPLNLFERGMLPAIASAREKGVPVIVRETLANGLLARSSDPADLGPWCRTAEEAAARASQLASFREAAAARGCTLAQLALRDAMEVAGVAVTLVGARTRAQIEDLLRQVAGLDVPSPARVQA
ncbi:MAG TPA: aldo/keto reductase [Myxococcales bacterium]|nr:aldo/keto reductase [Myxococcales bacterium]